MTEPTNVELQELVEKLARRLDEVESELAELKKRSDQEVSEDVLLAISAAVSAYLGNRGKVKAVKLARHSTWAAQGRQQVQTRHTPHF
ncbi:hypothetical protein [Corynebacterium epidermidicanis]|uniref:Uncharacterized protein n=1 Tax=Corynebacterium epidermidicanis TaxID=1050174 RepID=A0A0G3GMW9_9CORY|nr:hypothetical protein [Corynebacterium epidermidicanis]AKK02576.1 hypothetical protein CEPID_03485 [Corynebacterium epidermidicanis]